MRTIRRFLVPSVAFVFLATASVAADKELAAGDPAPVFTAKTHDGATFDLASRKGSWTVLYFYPKSGTPGCTKQACAFRDGIDPIRAAGAEVYGISTDTVEGQAAFHEEQNLNFTLLADPEGAVTIAYGAKMPIVTYAKRWTFIVDPTLTIRQVQHDVDPTEDAARVAEEIARLKGAGASAAPSAAAPAQP
jgi:peroxiredoxin Q/BCP